MSGGERKKRGCDRGHGWEEAGAEFYQESYPAAIEADLQQALQRDPSHIATLLPSKKSRVGRFIVLISISNILKCQYDYDWLDDLKTILKTV